MPPSDCFSIRIHVNTWRDVTHQEPVLLDVGAAGGIESSELPLSATAPADA